MLNLDNIRKNTSLIIEEQINVNVVALKTIVPCIIGTAIIGGLKQLATDKSCEIVRAVVIDTLNYSSMAGLVLGCLVFIRGLDQYYASIEARKVQLVKLPKQDLDAMEREILILRQKIFDLVSYESIRRP